MGMRNFWRNVVWVGFLLLLAGVCRGDGGFIPATSFTTMPTMPQQRAVIAFDGKRETLMVESVMQADAGTRFAWLLPLPAKPDAIRPADVGLLNTLSFCCGPEIHNATHAPLFGTFMLIIMTLLITVRVASRSAYARKQAEGCLILWVIISVLPLIAVGELPKSNSSLNDGTTVLSNERVGNYRVVVLAARHAAEIEAWLTAHQFAGLPVESRAIVEDYLAQGWVIVAAELQRSGTGRLAPHPLSVTFPATQPIYPMRLTAMGKAPVEVSLFVAAPQRYAQAELETVNAQTAGWRLREFNPDLIFARDEAFAALHGRGAWITHLQGRVSPARMTQDFTLVPAQEQTMARQVVYTPKGALWETLYRVMWVLVVVMPVAALVARRRGRSVRLVLAAVLLGALIVIACLWVTYPMVHGTRTVSDFQSKRAHYYHDIRVELAPIKDAKLDSAQKTEAAVRGRLLAKRRNLFTDEPLREEASPGNYQFERTSATLTLAMYDETGGATRFAVLGPEPEKKPWD